ncbi:MAG: sigma-70 family RNA polymerase sigma factor [Phycisphaerales bacterium]|nr:sigma-70 family RNA polymerase sigma factor [Phycisphaerales bacterium]MCI0629247.1 sigma-70 family RNA polymerase sigma factor [Phycisphaerales bacterium]MCI0675871.1 sigma-70 family RNA polymerase sigma factor [Phycisphaerales bacterium]
MRPRRAVPSKPGQITQLLQEVSDGHQLARDTLLEQVYEQLRAIAQQRINRERPGHTLQATALVHEAYLRMLGDQDVAWTDRGHFYRAAAEAMRRILVDHARRRGAEKRGGDHKRLPLNVRNLAAIDDSEGILAVDDAILRLQEYDASLAELVRLRFFAGLSVEQTATALGVSERTLRRDWNYARAKLFRLLQDSDSLA